ncbi:MAG: DUF2953 domain-containing protein [Dethiobacteria bacterium]|jgi:hypothetical protein
MFFLLFLPLLVLLLLLWPITVCIKIDNLRENKTIKFLLELYIFKRTKVFRVKKGINVDNKIDGQRLSTFFCKPEASGKSKGSRIFQFLRKYQWPTCYFLRTLRWDELDFFLRLGTGDPAWTAIITGFLRSFAGLLSFYLSRYLIFIAQKPRLLIYPSFFKQEFSFMFSIEFNFNLLKVLLFLAAMFIVKLRERWFRYVRSSHSGLNENSHGKFERNGGC